MANQSLAGRLRRWGCDKQTKAQVMPVLTIGERGNVARFEIETCNLFSRVLKDYEQHAMSPEAASKLFTIIDLYVTEKDLRAQLMPETQELLFEGLLFHDLGTKYGPDVNFMHQLIKKRLALGKKGNRENSEFR